MLTNSPWTNPLDFVGAAAKGAGLGLQASQIATGANEAADRLRLSYAQLGAEQQARAMQAGEASAAHALQTAHLQNALQQWQAEQERLRQQHADEIGVQNAHIGIQQQHQAFTEKEAADRLKLGNAKKLVHIGTNAHTWDPTSGTLSGPLIDQPAKVDPFTRLKYQAALNRKKAAQTALARPRLEASEKAALEAELKAADDEARSIERGPTPIPSDWFPGSVHDARNPVTPDNAADSLSAPSLNPDDEAANTFSVGKYKVTPLK